MKSKHIFLSILIAGALLFFNGQKAVACSPLPPKSVVRAFLDADAVFSGRVVSIVPPSPDSEGAIYSGDPAQVTFAVSKWFTGQKSKRTTVVTASSSVSCGYEFEMDKEYLVYAYSGSGNVLSTDISSRTKELSEAGGDVRALSVLKTASTFIPVLGVGFVTVAAYALYKIFKRRSVI